MGNASSIYLFYQVLDDLLPQWAKAFDTEIDTSNRSRSDEDSAVVSSCSSRYPIHNLNALGYDQLHI